MRVDMALMFGAAPAGVADRTWQSGAFDPSDPLQAFVEQADVGFLPGMPQLVSQADGQQLPVLAAQGASGGHDEPAAIGATDRHQCP